MRCGPVRDLHAADRHDHQLGRTRSPASVHLVRDAGWDVIMGLSYFVITVLLRWPAHVRGAAAVGCALMAACRPRFFPRQSGSDPHAFATASSSATLTVTLRVAEENRASAQGVALRADGRCIGQPPRHRVVRRRDRAVLRRCRPRPVVDRTMMVLGMCISADRHCRYSVGLAAVIAMICSIIGCSLKASRSSSASTLPRHVPHLAQRHGE